MLENLNPTRGISNGVACPHCGGRMLASNSRLRPDGIRRRRRRCVACGHADTTFEAPKDHTMATLRRLEMLERGIGRIRAELEALVSGVV